MVTEPPAAAYETRRVLCPVCGGNEVLDVRVPGRHILDTDEVPCDCGDGFVIVHVATIDNELTAWCPSLGLLAVVDEAELQSGDWTRQWPADRLDLHDRVLLGELGADL